MRPLSLLCGDVLDGELTRLDKLLSEVVLNGDVLGPRMEGWALRKRECALAVTEDDWGRG